MADDVTFRTFVNGAWVDGDAPVLMASSHATWLGSSVFDGARAFEGVTPDLDLHCARVNDSARALGLTPTHQAGELVEIALDGVARFPSGAELYIRPTYCAETAGPTIVAPLGESARFHMAIFAAPMPPATGFTITTTSFRRPTMECMPTDAKAGCLYPNNARMLREAAAKGFGNALVCDALGNVAELATANIFMARDGIVATPAPNGTFLNGVTRRRVIKLLRETGVTVEERVLTVRDFREADEIFSTGNAGKVLPVIGFDDRALQPGPFFAQARAAYWDFAHR